MAEFFQLSTAERLDALNAAANTSGLLPHLLEKDIWVVWSLRHLFAGPYADHLVFKGGTSLSKAYGVIRRFSEDVDLTYDIRAIAGDLVGDTDAPLPTSKSQEKKWTKEIRARLSNWVGAEIAPRLKRDLEQHGLPATVRAEGDKVFIDYTPLTTGTGYVAPAVMMEFGARSTGEPNEPRAIRCDAAEYLQGVEFPATTQHHMSCAPSAPSGKRPRRFTFSARKANFAGVTASPATGMTLRDWMPPASPMQPLRTKPSPAQLPNTKACSLQKRTLMAKSSTITPQSQVGSALYLMTAR